jgi:hydrogenase maturation protease
MTIETGRGPAPLLVLAVGNPSRGDDALGPMLLDRLRDAGWGAADDVELLTDFQLQVEHALDLRGRRAVLFVDAARPGVAGRVALARIQSDAGLPPASHALRPQAVLHVATRIDGAEPPAWLLAIEGHSFALGEGLSLQAQAHLERAVPLAQDWLREQREHPVAVPGAA